MYMSGCGKQRRSDQSLNVTRMRTKSLIFLVAVTCYLYMDPAEAKYRPVILMHGLDEGSLSMERLAGFIREAHPGTAVLNVQGFSYWSSYRAMWKQVDGVYREIQPFVEKAEDGVNMICYSQGGLVCRGILEKYGLRVHTFVSLSSPQAGQYGVPGLQNTDLTGLSRIAYNFIGQVFSVPNYWNDPHNQDDYMKYSTFLAKLNNPPNAAFRSNFLRVQQLILIGGPNDEVISPWQSSHFSYYDENENVVPFVYQDYYVKDSFGLRTLHQQGRMIVFAVPGVKHLDWPESQMVFDSYIEPYLL